MVHVHAVLARQTREPLLDLVVIGLDLYIRTNRMFVPSSLFRLKISYISGTNLVNIPWSSLKRRHQWMWASVIYVRTGSKA